MFRLRVPYQICDLLPFGKESQINIVTFEKKEEKVLQDKTFK